MEKENSYAHIFKYTSLFGGVQGLNILIALVRNKFVAVLLGPVGMGLISLYNTASVLLQNSTNFGIQTTGVRELAVAFKEGKEEELRRRIRILRSWSIVVALLGMFVTMTISPLLSLWAFSDGEYTRKFMCLAPVVALAAISGGEVAVLKATRRLKDLANVSVLSVLGALVVSVPLYVAWGNDGIIPSLILIAIVQMVITVCFSYRHYPLSIRLGRELSEGRSILTIGLAFVLAGVAGSGAEFVVRAFLSDMSLSLVGLFNTGYMITMTYAGMMFAAMETDYFPYLSSICHDTQKMNGAVNRQIEVSSIMVAPCLVALMLGLPIVIPLLFSSQFLPVIGMTQVAILAMYFRSMNLPIAYITLAKGDSRSYLFMELIYDVMIVVAIIVGYYNWGLEGTGIALVVACAIESVCLVTYCRWQYDFEISYGLLSFLACQIGVAVTCLLVVRATSGVVYWSLGLLLVGVSVYLSWRKFKQRIYD